MSKILIVSVDNTLYIHEWSYIYKLPWNGLRSINYNATRHEFIDAWIHGIFTSVKINWSFSEKQK